MSREYFGNTITEEEVEIYESLSREEGREFLRKIRQRAYQDFPQMKDRFEGSGEDLLSMVEAGQGAMEDPDWLKAELERVREKPEFRRKMNLIESELKRWKESRENYPKETDLNGDLQ